MGAVREMVIPGEEGEVLAVGCMAEEVELMEVEALVVVVVQLVALVGPGVAMVATVRTAVETVAAARDQARRVGVGREEAAVGLGGGDGGEEVKEAVAVDLGDTVVEILEEAMKETGARQAAPPTSSSLRFPSGLRGLGRRAG